MEVMVKKRTVKCRQVKNALERLMKGKNVCLGVKKGTSNIILSNVIEK